MHKHATARGSGDMLLLESFEALRLLLRHNILGPIRCFLEARRRSFTRMNIYPFCPLHHTTLVLASHRSLTSQATPFADEACGTISVRLEEQKVVGRLGRAFCTVHSHLASFIQVSCVIGGHAWAIVEHWC